MWQSEKTNIVTITCDNMNTWHVKIPTVTQWIKKMLCEQVLKSEVVDISFQMWQSEDITEQVNMTNW